MNNKFDASKGSELISSAFKKTAEISKKAVDSAKKGVKDISEKSKKDKYERKMKKYNPLFPEQYAQENFHIPNLIMIVDDAVRRDVDVCEGAIGWLSKEGGVEILCLYDEAVETSGIQFIPTPHCDSIYYVDSFDRNRFINIDRIFGLAHEERLAELKHIAYSLGATKCTIEISESNTEMTSNSKSISGKQSLLKKASFDAAQSSSHSSRSQRSGKIVATFTGSTNPVVPQLKWFANDDNIKRLIEMRCDDKNGNAIKSETVEIEGSNSATMSQKTACAIDIAVSKLGGSCSCNMESKAINENMSKLTFSVEFP